MLLQILEDGYFYHQCYNEECRAILRSSITDRAVEYRTRSNSIKGSVIALPPCPECGWRTELKADYTVKEVLRGEMLHYFVTQGQERGYAMELRYARSFRLLNMLCDIGKMPEHPLLPVVPFDAIKQSELRGLPYDVVDSFCLPYALFGRAIDYEGIDQHIIALSQAHHITPLIPASTPPLHESRRLLGNA